MAFGFRRYNAGIVTRRLTLDDVSPDPAHPIVLIMRHAGVTNPAWDSWQLRHPVVDDKPAKTPEERLAERQRNVARTNELFSEAVLAGWESVTDEGAAVPFTPEAARRFLDELAENCLDVWNRIQLFAYSVSNFRGESPDPVELGKG